MIFANLTGRLSFEAFPHDLITAGGASMEVFGALAVIAGLTYFKKWGWIWKNWLTSLDPKKIGVMYIVVAVVMLLRGFADVLMMRAQQAVAAGSNTGFLDANHFQQVFSAHGSIMIFFVAMGLMFGLINLVMPLQIGSRDVAFPFLNSVSFWLFVAGMLLMNLSLVFGEFSAAGWLAYPPLSELAYSPGVGVDYWIWALQIAGIGTLLSGINFAVTIVKMRAPGMTWFKMPLFSWSVLCSMILVMFAFPILTVSLALLALDRTMGMHFFTASGGGNPMMYVNLIWAWGHPEVYILVLPAFGVFSEVVSTFSRKALFGYRSMVYALIAITFLSYTVWLHHFFTMGASANVNAFFGIMTAVIAVPTGVKVFNWLFTMYKGKIHFASPMYWFFGFVFTFTIGGVAGVLMSVPAIDYQVHNSLFLVAHFHMMIVGGVVFGYFAGITYWFPKIFGFKLNERLGKAAFWCWLIGFLTAFIPLYALGLMGATRRLNHYDASLGWQPLFIVAGLGALIVLAGVALQVLQFAYSIYDRKNNLDLTGDPWNGRTLEWSTSSPPPEYNFAAIPQVTHRDEFWYSKQSNHKSKHAQPDEGEFTMPKNTGFGIYIAGAAFVLGFAVIWHLYWLVITALVLIISLIIARSNQVDTTEIIKATKARSKA